MKIRIWDNGGATEDRYTILAGDDYYGASEHPFSPGGIAFWIGNIQISNLIEGPYRGTEVRIEELPDEVQRFVADLSTNYKVELYVDSYGQPVSVIRFMDTESTRIFLLHVDEPWTYRVVRLGDMACIDHGNFREADGGHFVPYSERYKQLLQNVEFEKGAGDEKRKR